MLLLYWDKLAPATAWQDPPQEDLYGFAPHRSLKFRVLERKRKKLPIDWEKEEECHSFYKQQSSKSEVVEVQAITGSCLAGLAVLLRAKPKKWASWSEDPLSLTGRNSSAFWSAFGSGSTASPGTKGLAGTNMLPHSLV